MTWLYDQMAQGGGRLEKRDSDSLSNLWAEPGGAADIICSREQAARARRKESDSEELTNHMQMGPPAAARMSGKSANQQRRVPISNQRAGLEVLGERDVSWKESRHEARQEVTGASVVEFLYQR